MKDVELLIEQLSQGASPVAPAAHPYKQCAKWLVGFSAYIFALLFFFLPRPDLSAKFTSPLFVAEILKLLAIIVTCSLSRALLSFPDMMQKKRLAMTPMAAFAAFVLVIIVEYLADRPRAPAPEHEMLCTLCLTLFSLLPAIWMFAVIRKAATTHKAICGYIATLCAFSIGGLTLRLSEQTDSISHLLQWHYFPMLLMSMVGIILGNRLLKW
jgi:hypothetical protein